MTNEEQWILSSLKDFCHREKKAEKKAESNKYDILNG